MPKAKKAAEPKSSASAKPYDAPKSTSANMYQGWKGDVYCAEANNVEGHDGNNGERETTKKDKVRLTNTEDPTITRLLIVPSNFAFADFHEVLQVAFGWANCHMHTFDVSKMLEEGQRPNFMTGKGECVPTLQSDNLTIDAYPEPDKIQIETDYTLADIYASESYGGKVEVSYEYDTGDGWNHDITFVGRTDLTLRKVLHVPDELEAFCLGGEGHPCAEDCGAAPGWEHLKNVFKKGRKDTEGLKDWYKTVCSNGDPKGLVPYKWDMLDVIDDLAKIKAQSS